MPENDIRSSYVGLYDTRVTGLLTFLDCLNFDKLVIMVNEIVQLDLRWVAALNHFFIQDDLQVVNSTEVLSVIVQQSQYRLLTSRLLSVSNLHIKALSRECRMVKAWEANDV